MRLKRRHIEIMILVLSFVLILAGNYDEKPTAPSLVSVVGIGCFLATVTLMVTKMQDDFYKYSREMVEWFGKVEKRRIEKPRLIELEFKDGPTPPVKTARSVLIEAAYSRIMKDLDSVIAFAANETVPFTITSQNPCYKLMHSIIKSIPNGSLYIATSKLSNYGEVSNKDFRLSQAVHKSRAGQGVDTLDKKGGFIKSYRLYYPLHNDKLQETLEAIRDKDDKKNVATGTAVERFLALEENDRRARHDLAFIFHPKKNIDPSVYENLDTDIGDFSRLGANFTPAYLMQFEINEQNDEVNMITVHRASEWGDFSVEFEQDWTISEEL